TQGLGVEEMAIAPPCEDVVTMAASAGARLLRAAHVDPETIGMLLVATETGVDNAKPVAIFVHELLGVGRRCRVYELKHACYRAALARALTAFRGAGRPALRPDEALGDRLARMLYHSPFPKMAMKAHRRLVELDWRATERWAAVEPRLEEAAAASYRELVAPG